jgi:hypothetical protein
MKTKTPKPPRLLEGYIANFDTLKAAGRNNDLALVSAIRKADNKPVALVCAMNVTKDEFRPLPIAVMVEGNPYELFHDPTT